MAEKPDNRSDKSGIKPGMNEAEIRDAGLAVDVPFETGDGSQRLRYADLGEEKRYKGGAAPPGGEAETTESDDE
jgi:hypothetical protein